MSAMWAVSWGSGRHGSHVGYVLGEWDTLQSCGLCLGRVGDIAAMWAESWESGRHGSHVGYVLGEWETWQPCGLSLGGVGDMAAMWAVSWGSGRHGSHVGCVSMFVLFSQYVLEQKCFFFIKQNISNV